MNDRNDVAGFLGTFGILAGLVLGVFGLIHVFDGELIIGYTEIFLSAVVWGNKLLFYFLKNVRFSTYVLLMAVMSGLMLVYITGGVGGSTGAFWFFVMPVASFFLLSRIEAIIVICLHLLSVVGIYYLSFRELITIPYDGVETRQLIISYLVVAVLVAHYKRSVDTFKDELSEKNDELVRNIVDRDERVSELMQSYEELNQNKMAMLNLLEDARELEHELTIQKENIEEEVLRKTKELRTEKANLVAVIENISSGLIVVNKELKVTMWNNRIKDILGVSEVNFEAVAFALKDSGGVEKMVENCIATSTGSRVELLAYKTKSLSVLVEPIKEGGKTVSVLLSVVDITDEVVLQRSRDEFFSIASHELRTPLTSIRGNSSMVMEMYANKIADKDFKEMLSDIHEGSVRLIGIVNEFLDLGRLEQGKISYKSETINIKDLSSEIEGDLATLLTEKKGAVVFKNLCKNVNLIADKDRLRMVITNLLGNALKFTEKGFISVSSEVDEEKKMVRINVTDTGTGIPEENQALLFRKFQQAGSSLYTRDTSKGTGLGLYVSKLMVEAMGGKIWLENSVVGEGSQFSISLPLEKKLGIEQTRGNGQNTDS